MGTELRRAQCAKQAKRKSNEQRRLASGSVARRLLRIVGTRESRKRACERCGTTIPNCGTRPKGVRSAGTPRRREGGQRPTRPRQFGGRSPEICRAVPARRQRRVRGRNRRGRCEDTEHRAAKGGTVRRCGLTMPHCGTVARRSRDGGIGNLRTARLCNLKIKTCNFE